MQQLFIFETKQGGGEIVMTSSIAGLTTNGSSIAYCASKAALNSLTRTLAKSLGEHQIRVNAVCPNEVNTPMLRSGFEMRGFDADSAIEQLNQTVPLGRIAEPGEIAEAIAYLASDQASWITGTNFTIDGGLTQDPY